MALALCNCLEKMVIGPKTNFGLPSNSLNILSDSNNSRICNLDIGFWVLNFEGLPMLGTCRIFGCQESQKILDLQPHNLKSITTQEKSITTQEQGNSKLDFRKLHCSFNVITIGFLLVLDLQPHNLKSRGYPDEEWGGQEKSRTTQEQGNSKLDFWKLETALQFSFNYNLIFVLSLAFNLTNLKSRGYPDKE
ncbi:unnamed protein product [Prunus armeniaca]